jgi:hypothetical protein
MQYCGSILNPDVPSSVLRYLLSEEQAEDDDWYLHKVYLGALFVYIVKDRIMQK